MGELGFGERLDEQTAFQGFASAFDRFHVAIGYDDGASFIAGVTKDRFTFQAEIFETESVEARPFEDGFVLQPRHQFRPRLAVLFSPSVSESLDWYAGLRFHERPRSPQPTRLPTTGQAVLTWTGGDLGMQVQGGLRVRHKNLLIRFGAFAQLESRIGLGHAGLVLHLGLTWRSHYEAP